MAAGRRDEGIGFRGVEELGNVSLSKGRGSGEMTGGYREGGGDSEGALIEENCEVICSVQGL